MILLSVLSTKAIFSSTVTTAVSDGSSLSMAQSAAVHSPLMLRCGCTKALATMNTDPGQ